jgi:type II secretory pathway pseudopilin PulG
VTGIEIALAIAAVAVSAAGAAYSAVSSGQAAAANAEAQSDYAQYESAQNEENAKAAKGREAEISRRILASHSPNVAKTGVALLGPEAGTSEFEVYMANTRDRALVEADAAYGYSMRAGESAYRSKVYSANASSARTQGYVGAGVSLLSGAAQAGGMYYGSTKVKK